MNKLITHKSSNSMTGPESNEKKGHMLYIPSVVENHDNCFGENVNSL